MLFSRFYIGLTSAKRCNNINQMRIASETWDYHHTRCIIHYKMTSCEFATWLDSWTHDLELYDNFPFCFTAHSFIRILFIGTTSNHVMYSLRCLNIELNSGLKYEIIFLTQTSHLAVYDWNDNVDVYPFYIFLWPVSQAWQCDKMQHLTIFSKMIESKLISGSEIVCHPCIRQNASCHLSHFSPIF